MSHEPLEVTSGSGNVFADLGYPDADVRQAKAILAAEIIKSMDAGKLTVRKAHERTGIAAADFSRIRSCDLGRFTIDRLVKALCLLDGSANVQVTVTHRPATRAAHPHPSL